MDLVCYWVELREISFMTLSGRYCVSVFNQKTGSFILQCQLKCFELLEAGSLLKWAHFFNNSNLQRMKRMPVKNIPGFKLELS
jgi:hypothetical protein